MTEESKKLRVLDKADIVSTIAMLSAIEAKYGREAVNIAIDAYHKAIKEVTENITIPASERTVESIVKYLWQRGYGEVQYEIIEKNPESLRVRVTSCYYADLCRQLEEKYPSARSYGRQLYCNWNYDFTRSWNKELDLSLDRNLMDGDAFCSFYYFYKKKK